MGCSVDELQLPLTFITTKLLDSVSIAVMWIDNSLKNQIQVTKIMPEIFLLHSILIGGLIDWCWKKCSESYRDGWLAVHVNHSVAHQLLSKNDLL